MNRHFASALSFAASTAAVACVAIIASTNAYAEGPIGEASPFVSSRTRAEVKAELIAQPELMRANTEWAMQQMPPTHSAYTREQVKAQYIAARDEVRALNSEDSGSSYLAQRRTGPNAGTIMAGTAR